MIDSKAPPQVVSPNANVLLTEMPDRTGLLLDLRSKAYYTLNSSAVLLWKKIGSPREVVEELSTRYAQPIQIVERDVTELMQEFIAEGLVDV